jgi:hypothetical protein
VSIQGRLWSPKPGVDPVYALWIVFQKRNQCTELNSFEKLVTCVEHLNMYDTKSQPLPKSPPYTSTFPTYLAEKKDVLLDIEEFEIIESLGEGSYSFVKLCVYRKDPLKVLIHFT